MTIIRSKKFCVCADDMFLDMQGALTEKIEEAVKWPTIGQAIRGFQDFFSVNKNPLETERYHIGEFLFEEEV